MGICLPLNAGAVNGERHLGTIELGNKDDLIKAALAWSDGAKEITGSGTAEDPWTNTVSNRNYVKDTETPKDGQQKATHQDFR